MQPQAFQIPFENQVLVGDDMTGGRRPSVLLLHGGGRSCRCRFDSLHRSFLAAADPPRRARLVRRIIDVIRTGIG